MTKAISRETRAVYMQQRGHATITCVTLPILFSFGLRILLLHALIAAYILPLFLYFLALSSLHPLTF